MKSLAQMRRIALPFVVMLLLAGATFAAQETNPGVGKKSVIDLFKTTGFVGWLMVACSVVGTSLAIEHAVIRREARAEPGPGPRALIDEGARALECATRKADISRA
jgi:hypothetical protein